MHGTAGGYGKINWRCGGIKVEAGSVERREVERFCKGRAER